MPRPPEDVPCAVVPLVPALTALALVGLAACGGGDDDDGGGAARATRARARSTLDYWAWAPNIAEVVDIWNEENPDIQVKVNDAAQGDDLVTKVLTAHRAGNGPDLVQAEYQALPSLVVNDVVTDITEDTADVQDAFTDDIWSLTTFNDAVYAVPQDLAPMMLFYRADIFDQLGLEVPETWDEFRAVAEQVRAEGPRPAPDDVLHRGPGLVRRPGPAGRRAVVVARRRHRGRSASTTRRASRSPTTGATWWPTTWCSASRCTRRSGTPSSTTAR